MTSRPQLALALLGTAVIVVVIQYARDINHFVGAPPAAAYGVHGSASGGNAGRRAAEPQVVTPERGTAMPVTGTRPGGTPAGSADVGDEAAVEAPEMEPMTFFGIPLPAWLEELVGRRRSSVAGGMPLPSADAPVTTTSTTPGTTAAGTSGCKHDPAPHPQGITAEVDFVGVLLNGQQREDESFTGAELDDLKIVVEWKSLLENHAQRVDLIAPDGSLYQSLTRLVTAGDNGAPLETRVPVNGTWITRYGLYGAWCVEVFLDQESAPVTSSRLVIAKPQ